MNIKPIKFNLMLSFDEGGELREQAISNLEALRDNFYFDYVYQYFLDGILERWLSVRNCTKELEKLKEIKKDKIPSEDNIQKFIEVFFNSLNKEAYFDLIKAKKSYQKSCAFIKDQKNNQNDLKANALKYMNAYDDIAKKILEEDKNTAKLQQYVNILIDDYYDVFSRYDSKRLLALFFKENPIALLFFILNSKTRGLFKDKPYVDYLDHISSALKGLNDSISSKLKYTESAITCDDCGSGLQQLLFKYLKPVDPNSKIAVDNTIFSTIKICNKDTGSSWDDIEPDSNKQFMILAGPANNIRPYKAQNQELTAEQISHFPVIRGIEYRSSSSCDPIIYMEV